MNRILGGIYLSSLSPLQNGDDLASRRITHVLSIIPGDVPSVAHLVHKQIALNDALDENIIQYFDECHSFINECLFPDVPVADINIKTPHTNRILIHCHEGLSRSVTVLVSYLMKFYKLLLDQAIHAVKRKQDININENFMTQLQLYEKIHFDLSHHLYREFVVSLSLKHDKSGAELPRLMSSTASSSSAHTANDTPPAGFIRCKLCRFPLAKSSQVFVHEPPDQTSSQASFVKKAKNSRMIFATELASVNCSHYFLNDPVAWMKPVLEEELLEGKFNCPNAKCNAKVGGYSWKGSRCSCGKWIVPAIHLAVSKVDFIKSSNK